MPDYYQNVNLNLKDVDELDFGFYYDSKRHRYEISINMGEEYINVTRKEGETILAFLRILKDFLGSRRNIRTPGTGSCSKDDSHGPADQGLEHSFEFDGSVDKIDIEDEWDSFEKDQLANEHELEV